MTIYKLNYVVFYLLSFMQVYFNCWYGTIPEWLTAIGTIGAIFVALFGKTIRQWWNRPKIEFSCEKMTPYVDVIENDNQSSSVTKELRLRVKMVNNGNYIANNCLLVVDSYYTKRSDGKYVIKEFTPKQMRDYRNSSISYVAPHLNYYYDIFSIRQYDALINANEKGHSKQLFKPAIIGEGRPIVLSKGAFIVPLKFYSSKLPTKVVYICLFWDNDDCSIDPGTFDYSIISSKEFELIDKA